MKRNERVVGGSEERFPRQRLLEMLESSLTDLSRYPRNRIDEPIKRKRTKAVGLTVPRKEVGKRRRATGSARESIRSWLHSHGVLDSLGLRSNDILVGVDHDPDHVESDPGGCVVRIYRVGIDPDSAVA